MVKPRPASSVWPIAFAVLVMSIAWVRAEEFGAYYTKVDSGEEFERVSRTGPEADIVVRGLGEGGGRLVFWRGSSYLPYWEVGGEKHFLKELTPRSGDGSASRPDKVNSYSVARIIESSPEKVVIHWRYLPRFEGSNPHFTETNLVSLKDHLGDKRPEHLVAADKFVDEYFSITPDGRVERTFRPGTEKYDDWADPKNVTTQELKLTAKGIEVVSEKAPERSMPPAALKGNPLVAKTVIPPVKWWKFDEGAGDVAKESIDGESCGIEGPKAYWKQGVSGTALAFDGYHSAIRLPADKAPDVSSGLTLEAWVAIGAYPWNWTPIIQQGHEESYYLGIGSSGNVAFSVRVGGKLARIESTQKLELRRWYHLAATYDKESGRIFLSIDGKPAGELLAGTEGIDPSASPLQIGKGKELPQTNATRGAFPADFSFDGLIDEVRIYNAALSPVQIEASRQSIPLPKMVDLDARELPSAPKTGLFGGRYTRLKTYDTWEGLFRFGEHPDVVVEFDKNPNSFVFWHGAGYVPMIANEKGQWYSNEFNETWNRSGGKGCMEPMSDKESFSNHVKILENTPARVVVQWRFPLLDVLRVQANYNDATGWGDWSDWTYTIYPDGVAVKRMRLWSSGPINHEWQETMVITGAGQHPEQVVEADPAIILATLDGTTREYAWKDGPPRGVDFRDAKIQLVNFKAENRPFTIGDFQRGNVYAGELTKYSVFPSWNHWPEAQMPSDGRSATSPDRIAHSSLTHVYVPVHKNEEGERPFQERLLLEGMTKLKPAELVPLAKSWLQAPPIQALSGCQALTYDPARREYPLIAESETLAVSIAASNDHPLENVCFTVKNREHDGPAKVEIQGAELREVRQGMVVDPDGLKKLILWLEVASTSPVEFTIHLGKDGKHGEAIQNPPTPQAVVSSSQPITNHD